MVWIVIRFQSSTLSHPTPAGKCIAFQFTKRVVTTCPSGPARSPLALLRADLNRFFRAWVLLDLANVKGIQPYPRS